MSDNPLSNAALGVPEPNTRHPFGTPAWHAEHHLVMIERGFERLSAAIEAVEAIADAGEADGMMQQAAGLRWVSHRAGDDLMQTQADFEKFRAYFETINGPGEQAGDPDEGVQEVDAPDDGYLNLDTLDPEAPS